MHNDILDVEGCRVLAWFRSGIYSLIGIAWLRGVSVGKFDANGSVLFHWLNLLTRAPSSIILLSKLAKVTT